MTVLVKLPPGELLKIDTGDDCSHWPYLQGWKMLFSHHEMAQHEICGKYLL